jgi:hypothetical protein
VPPLPTVQSAFRISECALLGFLYENRTVGQGYQLCEYLEGNVISGLYLMKSIVINTHGDIASPFLTSTVDGRYVTSHVTLVARGGNPRYPLDGRTDGPQSRSGRCGIDKHSVLRPGTEPRVSNPYPVVIRTVLLTTTNLFCCRNVLS